VKHLLLNESSPDEWGGCGEFPRPLYAKGKKDALEKKKRLAIETESDKGKGVAYEHKEGGICSCEIVSLSLGDSYECALCKKREEFEKGSSEKADV